MVCCPGFQETREASKILFFQKNWSKLLLILFLCFLHCSSTSNTQRTFVTLQFAAPTTQKFFNLLKEWGKYWTILTDKYIFSDGRFYRTLLQFLMWQFKKKTMMTKLLHVYMNDKNKKSNWMHHKKQLTFHANFFF
jgi:hypothetical protein